MAGAEKTQWYGWTKDIADRRDHIYAAPAEVLTQLPPMVDLRPACPPVYNQKHLGSCTANAIAAAIEFDLMKKYKGRIFVPSRLFIYYNERALEGKTNVDSGASIRDGIKCVARQGDCAERLWPYIISHRNWAVKPPEVCYRQARKYRAVEYQRLRRDTDQMKACLASGHPFIFGFIAYDKFEGPEVRKTGNLSIPSPREKRVGKHAVLAVGYENKRFIVRNSWGADWGLKGYFTMPFQYMLDEKLSHDFWSIEVVA